MRTQKMKRVKKTGVMLLALALAVPMIAAPQKKAEAAKKAPSLLFSSTKALPDTSQTIYIEKNGAKILNTTWKTGDKTVAELSRKKKTQVDFKAGGAGDTSTKVTAKVKYKVGKKVKTKKLTCKVKVVWLSIERAAARTNQTDGNTELAIYFNLSTTNINKYDSVPEEGEILDVGYWTTNADKVAEVTETSSASGEAAKIAKVTDSDYRGRPIVTIDLGKPVTEKTSYHVTLMGYKGAGSKMIIETDITADPKKVTLTQVGYFNQENKGNISLILSTDVPFNVQAPEFDPTYNTYVKVLGEDGKELSVDNVVVATDKTEGDQIIINLKGGADSKKFTIELNNAFCANFADPTKLYYLAENSVVVDKLAPIV